MDGATMKESLTAEQQLLADARNYILNHGSDADMAPLVERLERAMGFVQIEEVRPSNQQLPTPWRVASRNVPIADTGDYDGVLEIRAANGALVVDFWNPGEGTEDAFDRIVKCMNAVETKAEPAVDAEMVAAEVLHHIDTMYPDMWKGVPRTARISVRNCMIREIENRRNRIEIERDQRGFPLAKPGIPIEARCAACEMPMITQGGDEEAFYHDCECFHRGAPKPTGEHG